MIPALTPAFINDGFRLYRGVAMAAGHTVVNLTPYGFISNHIDLPKLKRYAFVAEYMLMPGTGSFAAMDDTSMIRPFFRSFMSFPNNMQSSVFTLI